MTLRLLGALAVVVALSCGSGDDEPSAAAGRPAATGAEPAGALALTVRVPDPLVAGQPVTWHLLATNRSDADVTLTFPSAQRGEVVLLDGDGGEAYRWSDGMLFAQALGEEGLAAGDELAIELPGRLDVAPGTYRLEAGTTSDPAPDPVVREVVVTG